MSNLTSTAPTGAGNVSILNCDIGNLTQSGTADYTLIRFCDITSTNITGSAGLVAIFGGNPNFITINNAGARVVAKNVVTVAPVLSAGNANFVDSIVIAANATSNAITTAPGTIVTLANSQIIVPTFNNVARVSLSGFYSIFNCVYDKPNSTLVALSPSGGSTSSVDYFQHINVDRLILASSGQITFPDGSTQTTAFLNNLSSYATNTLLQSTSALLTPLTLTNTLTSSLLTRTDANTLTGQLVANTTFNSYQTNVAAATALLTPLTTTNTLTSQLVLNTAINTLTGNWNTAYQSVSSQPYTLVDTTSSIKPIRGINTASGIYSNIAGGVCNLASGKYSTVVAGFSGCATGYATFVGAGSGVCATGSYAVAVGGQCNTASGCYAVVAGGCLNRATQPFTTVAGGKNNCASGTRATIAGGDQHTASGNYSFVGGGYNNTPSGTYAAIAGGGINLASGNRTAVLGGQSNTASGTYSTTIAGFKNTTSGAYSIIVGGLGNFNPLRDSIIGGGVANHTGGLTPFNITAAASISGNGSQTCLIGTGIQNCFSYPFTSNNVSVYYATAASPLSAGTFSTATIAATGTNYIIINGDYSTCTGTSLSATSIYVYDRAINNTGYDNFIGGGKLNTASGCYSVVAGGFNNRITTSVNGTVASFSIIGGGCGNTASAYFATIAGGLGNNASCKGTIAGGQGNTASGYSSFVGGGQSNIAVGRNATTVGGASNCTNGNCSFIGGGISNNTGTGSTSFIGGGNTNIACGVTTNIVGGQSNTITVAGDCSSIVGGRCNRADAAYTFVAGGSANDTKGFANTFILGTGLSASKANYTYVNNLSVAGNIESNTNYVVTAALTANQTMPSSADTVLTLDPLNDPKSWFSRTAGTGLTARRITPTVPGYYHIYYQVSWQSGVSATGAQNNIQVMKVTGGTASTISIVQQPIINTSVNTTQNTSAITYMNGSTDYLYFQGYSSNAAQVVTGTSDGNWTKVEVFKIN